MREKFKNESGMIYFQQDIHLNARGFEIVAELLEENLPAILSW
jgi:hypothetical protein